MQILGVITFFFWTKVKYLNKRVQNDLCILASSWLHLCFHLTKCCSILFSFEGQPTTRHSYKMLCLHLLSKVILTFLLAPKNLHKFSFIPFFLFSIFLGEAIFSFSVPSNFDRPLSNGCPVK